VCSSIMRNAPCCDDSNGMFTVYGVIFQKIQFSNRLCLLMCLVLPCSVFTVLLQMHSVELRGQSVLVQEEGSNPLVRCEICWGTVSAPAETGLPTLYGT
jgi:hypothetical protein